MTTHAKPVQTFQKVKNKLVKKAIKICGTPSQMENFVAA
jgi:hypothetical protein